MAQFHHVGVPTTQPQPGETFLEGAGVHITDPEVHPYRFEFVRFEADSPLPDALKQGAHIAYMVDSLAAALQGEEVIIEPFDATPTIRAAFIRKSGVVIELMEAI